MQYMEYGYYEMIREIEEYAEKYDFAEIFSAGESVEGRGLYVVRIGHGRKKLFVNAAHHALEYITSAALMRFTGDFCRRVKSGEDMFGFSPAEFCGKISFYAMPMVNPDGVELCVRGADMENAYHRNIIAQTGIHNFSKVWQANINGVDLNHNYNAGWRSITDAPAPTRFGGTCPESEPETRAVVNFVRNIDFDMVIALHSQGREIYYDFGDLTAARSAETGAKLAEAGGYTLAKPEGIASFGGFKDWFIQEFSREGFTVEIGFGKNPLPLSVLDAEYESVAKILLTAMQCI